MVAPLIALAFGIGGLNKFREFRKKEDTRKSLGTAFDRLIAGASAGALPPGQAGPPRPVGVGGGSNLFPNQIEALQAIRESNPAAALDLAIKFQASNMQQQNFNTNLGMQSAKFELSRDIFEQGQFEFEQTNALANRTANTTQNDRLRELAALQSPQAANQLAGLKGEDSYNFIDQTTGGITKAFRQGTDEFKTAEGKIESSANTLGIMNDVRQTLRAFGQSGDPASLTARDLESNITRLQLEFKELFELGAISGSDLELMLGIIPDATSLREQFLSNPQALDQAFANASQIVQTANARALDDTAQWVGIDPQLILNSQAGQAQAQSINQVAGRELLVQQGQQQAADDVGFFEIDDRIAALRGDQDAQRRLDESGGRGQSLLLGPAGEGLVRQLGGSLLDAPGNFASAVGGFFTRGLVK